MIPIEITCVKDENEEGMKTNKEISDEIDTKNILELIDSKMPLSFRADWVKMKNDIKIPRIRKQNLLDKINSILREANIDVKEAW